MVNANICSAHSRRDGKPCTNPTEEGRRVCRAHGAAGGAPKGNRNHLIHGLYSRKIPTRRAIATIRQPHIVTTQQLVEVLAIIRAGLQDVDRQLTAWSGPLLPQQWIQLSQTIAVIRILVSRVIDSGPTS